MSGLTELIDALHKRGDPLSRSAAETLWELRAAATTLAVVEADNERLREELEAAQREIGRLSELALDAEPAEADAAMSRALLEIAREELKEAQRDAERYRWLRNHPLNGLEETTPCIRAADNDPKHWAITGDNADAAIDAAMAKEKRDE